jgi:1-acyl-sn-glycerol-3-phosphate acyltransferase
VPSRALEILGLAGALLGWLVFLALTLFWGVLVVPLTLLLSLVWPGVREPFAAATGLALRLYVRSMSIAKLRLEGEEKRLTGARILVANHTSRLDSPVLLAFEPRLAGPVRGYMLRVPIIGRIIRLLGFFDADAGERDAFDAMQRAAIHAIERGGGLLFYPEGTRSKTGEIGPFHGGAFRLAVDHGLPIQPVVIEGLDLAYPPGHVLPPHPRRVHARIRYLPPLHPPYGTGPRREVVRALAQRVRGLLVDELARMRAERRAGGV